MRTLVKVIIQVRDDGDDRTVNYELSNGRGCIEAFCNDTSNPMPLPFEAARALMIARDVFDNPTWRWFYEKTK